MDSKPPFKRTLSSSNLNAAQEIHNFIKVQQDALKDQIPVLNRDVTKSSMILPEQYGAATLRLCVDVKNLNEMETGHYLNWSLNCRSLLPLDVEHDGNSLLHSLSVYMFGVQDKRCVLRQLLYQRLFMEPSKGNLKSRWMLQNIARKTTWNKVIEMASDKVVDSQNNVDNLSSIHVFTMANILARPIIVIRGRDLPGEELPIGGIYLPLLRKVQECEKSPIILGYNCGQFVPLISSENLIIPLCKGRASEDALHSVPLVGFNFDDLPLNFPLPKEESDAENLRNIYLDVINISHKTAYEEIMIPAAMMKFKTPPAFSIELMWSLEQLTAIIYSQSSANMPGSANENEPVYTSINDLDDNNRVYESLIPCAELANGCKNNISSNNHHNLCTECYTNYLTNQNTALLCSRKNLGCNNFADNNTENMCTFCYRTFIAMKGSDVDRNAVIKCNTPACVKVGVVGFNGKCQQCFLTDHPNQFNDYNVSKFDDTYNALNISSSGANDMSSDNYDQLKRTSMVKNRPLPTLPNDGRDMQRYGYPVQNNVGSAISDNNSEPYLNPIDDTMRGAGSQYPMVSSSATALHGAAAYNTVPTDSVRSKILCIIAGCTNSIGSDGQHCNGHNPKLHQREPGLCLMKGCSNTAELNDGHLCMVCFQSQKHVVRESKVLDRSAMNPAAFDLTSMANVLPPIPVPRPAPVQPPVNPQYHFQSQMGIQNPNIPVSIPNLAQNFPNIPSPPNIPKSQGPASTFTARPNFTPPMAYGGFEGFNRQFATHDATLNWQKGGMVGKEGNDPKQCLHCDNHANPTKGGLCNECHRQKETVIQPNQAEPEKPTKCITDGCREAGYERFSFMCELCYKKHIDALKTKVPERQQNTAVAGMGNPPLLGDMSSTNIKNAPLYPPQVSTHQGFNTNYEMMQPQYRQGNIGGNVHGDNITGRQVGGGMPVSTSTVNPFITGTNPVGTYVNPMLQNPTLPANAGMQKCKGLSCDFFGSAEFGGYCSGCFLNITKMESVKESTYRTFAPPNVGQGPPMPNVPTAARCKVPQCPNFGASQRMGLCSECYQLHGRREGQNTGSIL